MEGKKILVTGGAGFIGSNLCEKLVRSNFVWSLDNYSTGSVANHVDGVQYIRGETLDIEALVPQDIELVFHLGEYSRVEQSFEDWQLVRSSNCKGTQAVFEFCKNRAIKIVYAGSSTKFGDGGLGRQQSPYGWSKAANTELLANYGRWFGLNYAITYFYNVYGQREITNGKYATLIGLYCQNSIEKKPLGVVLPGSQRRNFTHISDVIDALILVGECGYGDEFGIGSSESYSVLEVAKMFHGEIVYLPERRGNRLFADLVTEKTRELGWVPKRNLEDYVVDFLAKNNIHGVN